MDSLTLTLNSLLKYPVKRICGPYFNVHWLAIEGKQICKELRQKKVNKRNNLDLRLNEKNIENISSESHFLLKTLRQAVEYESYESLPDICLSLIKDSGLKQLLPYFVEFISEVVSRELHSRKPSLSRLIWMVHISDSIITSTKLSNDLILYLDRLLPIVTSILVCRKVCTYPKIENQWRLRDQASVVLTKILLKYERINPKLKESVIKQLTEHLYSTDECLATHYGCIIGLMSLGYEIVQDVLIPIIKPYLGSLNFLSVNDSKYFQFGSSFQMVSEAWLRVSGFYYRKKINAYKALSYNVSQILFRRKRFNKRNYSTKIRYGDIKKRRETFYSWVSDYYGDKIIIYSIKNKYNLIESFI